MPYLAQRKFTMFGEGFAAPGNAYGLPHLIPSALIERMSHRSLANMLSRRMITEVEAVADSKPTTGLEADPRVTNEGKGWWLVAGERCHGRNAASEALAALGG